MTDSGGSNGGTGTGTGSDASTATGPVAGRVQTDKAGYASELVAYRVVDQHGNNIADKVRAALGLPADGQQNARGGGDGPDRETARLLLVDRLAFEEGGIALAEVQGQTEAISAEFRARKDENGNLLEELLEELDAPHADFAPTALPAALSLGSLLLDLPKYAGAVADTLAYFRSDYSLTGRDLEVDRQALLFSVAGALAEKDISVYVPGFYARDGSDLLQGLAKLAEDAAHLGVQREALAARLPKPPTSVPETPKAGADAADAPADGGKGEGQDGGAAPNPDLLRRIARAVLLTDAALQRHEGFRTAWTTPPSPAAKPVPPAPAPPAPPAAMPAAGSTSQAPAVAQPSTPAPAPAQNSQRTTLDKALTQEGLEALEYTHLLMLSTFSSGGASTVRDLWGSNDNLGFFGGAAVSYILAPRRGRALAAGTLVLSGLMAGRIEDYTGGSGFGSIVLRRNDFRLDD